VSEDVFYSVDSLLGHDELRGNFGDELRQLMRYDNVRPKRATQVLLSHASRPRVCLSPIDRIDFVNANFLPPACGSSGNSGNYGSASTQPQFIAAQAPTVAGVGQFWRMVVDNGCQAVVQLTSSGKHDGVELCAEYYPVARGLDPVEAAGAHKALALLCFAHQFEE
jgi:protein tyrosine phosphatase